MYPNPPRTDLPAAWEVDLILLFTLFLRPKDSKMELFPVQTYGGIQMELFPIILSHDWLDI